MTMNRAGRSASFRYLFVLVAFTGPVLAYNDDQCGPIDVDQCFKNIQTFLRLTQLPYVTEEKQLDNLCKQAIRGYNCSTELNRYADCLSPKDKNLLPVFVAMAQYMFFMLCGDFQNNKGYLREAYLGYSDCILENQDKMDCCAEEAGIPDLPVLRMLEDSSKSMTTREIQTCCPVSRYIQCTSQVVSEFCGDAAANMTTEYIRRASGEQTEAECQKMPGYPRLDATTCAGPIRKCSETAASGAAAKSHNLMAVLFGLVWFLVWGKKVMGMTNFSY